MTDTQILDLIDRQLSEGEGWFIQRDDTKRWVLRIGNQKALGAAKLPWWKTAREAAVAAKAGVNLLCEAVEGPSKDDWVLVKPRNKKLTQP